MIDQSDMRIAPAPIVILARPQMAENIGSAARAMMNCGLTELRLVRPRDGWPNAAALPMAAGGAEIIETATVYESLGEAAHDIGFMAAATARRRDLAIRAGEPRDAARHMTEFVGKSAFLFGPEASGLDNDEVALSDMLVTAPLNPDYPSLNLAQAVLMMAWEWRVAMLDVVGTAPTEAETAPASVKERDYFFARLESELDAGGFFTSAEMAPTVKRNIRALFTRATLSSQEVSTLHGMVQALTRSRDSSDNSG